MKTLKLRGLLLALTVTAQLSLHAQGTVGANFSGGSGAVMYATLQQPVMIEFQQEVTESSLGLVLLNAYSSFCNYAGLVFQARGISLSGAWVSDASLNNFVTGVPTTGHNGQEFVFVFAFPGHTFAAGDRLFVSAGTAYSTSAASPSAPDGAGPYRMEVIGNTGGVLPATATAVPEPAIHSLAGLALLCGLLSAWCQRKERLFSIRS